MRNCIRLATTVFFFLFQPLAGAQAQSFRALESKVEQGGVLIIKIAPQWQSPAVFNPAISLFGNQYLPNKYGEVFVGVDVSTKPGEYVAILIEYGRGLQLNNDQEILKIVERSFYTRKRSPFIPTGKWEQERKVIRAAFDKGDSL